MDSANNSLAGGNSSIEKKPVGEQGDSYIEPQIQIDKSKEPSAELIPMVEQTVKTAEELAAVQSEIERDSLEAHVIGGQIPEAIQRPEDNIVGQVSSDAISEQNDIQQQPSLIGIYDQTRAIKNSHVTGNDVASGLFIELEKLKKNHQQAA